MKFASTTSVGLGFAASEASILQTFDNDERIPPLVVKKFNAMARAAGSVAILCLQTSDALTTWYEARDGEYDYAAWLEQSLEEAEVAWPDLP